MLVPSPFNGTNTLPVFTFKAYTPLWVSSGESKALALVKLACNVAFLYGGVQLVVVKYGEKGD
jgi:hypothetical protein